MNLPIDCVPDSSLIVTPELSMPLVLFLCPILHKLTFPTVISLLHPRVLYFPYQLCISSSLPLTLVLSNPAELPYFFFYLITVLSLPPLYLPGPDLPSLYSHYNLYLPMSPTSHVLLPLQLIPPHVPQLSSFYSSNNQYLPLSLTSHSRTLPTTSTSRSITFNPSTSLQRIPSPAPHLSPLYFP